MLPYTKPYTCRIISYILRMRKRSTCVRHVVRFRIRKFGEFEVRAKGIFIKVYLHLYFQHRRLAIRQASNTRMRQ